MKNLRVLLPLMVVAGLGAGVCAWISKERKIGSSNYATKSTRDDVLAVYKQLEKATQTGDGNLLVSLMSQKKIEEAKNPQLLEQMRQGFPADPSIRYEVRGVKTRGDHAAVLDKIVSSQGPPQYHLVKFILENGSWKTAEEELGSELIDQSVLEAAVPPKDGAFIRMGLPWDKIPYGSENTKWFKEDQIHWKLKATSDESFLYLRFESKAPLPTTGTELPADEARSTNGVPSSPDVMTLKTAAGKQFFVVVGSNPTTHATFDQAGHATSNRFIVQYSFSLEDAARETLFSDGTNDTCDPLIPVRDRFLDIRIPLTCLSLETITTSIELSEANSEAKILPYAVQRFSE